MYKQWNKHNKYGKGKCLRKEKNMLKLYGLFQK